MGQVVNFWDPLISAIFHNNNQCKLFIGYNSLVRKKQELLLNKFLSNANEITTLSMNTGPDFGNGNAFGKD